MNPPASNLHEKAREWTDVLPIRSCAKVGIFLTLVVGLSLAIAHAVTWPLILFLQCLLGVTFAHGLELQHEALHGQLFQSKLLSRLVGFLLGAPMLVSFTHYQRQHLHHHRYLGTDKDQEIFDYDATLLTGPVAFFIRGWNLARIPSFLLTVLDMLQRRYPRTVRSHQARRQFSREYIALAGLLLLGVSLVMTGVTRLPLIIWFIPWLLFGETAHFLIELPEHLGCDKSSTNVYESTRSYATNWLMEYVVNGNNYHVEHHLFPFVSVHHLAKVRELIRPQLTNYLPSYRAAVVHVLSARAGSANIYGEDLT